MSRGPHLWTIFSRRSQKEKTRRFMKKTFQTVKGIYSKLGWKFNSISRGLLSVDYFSRRSQKEKTRRFMKKDNPLDER